MPHAPAALVFIDLNDISLRPGERHESTYSLELAPIALGGVSYEILLPSGVTVTVDRVAGGFLIDVSTDVRVYGPCARCLVDTVLDVQAEQQEFAPTSKDGWEGSDLSAFITDLVVDVASVVREAVVLALPPQIICSPECKGLCAQCGQDLNRGECSCAPSRFDDRWERLKDLRLPDEPGS